MGLNARCGGGWVALNGGDCCIDRRRVALGSEGIKGVGIAAIGRGGVGITLDIGLGQKRGGILAIGAVEATALKVRITGIDPRKGDGTCGVGGLCRKLTRAVDLVVFF